MVRKMASDTWSKILASFKSVGILHLLHGSQDFTEDAFVFVYNTEYTHAEHTFSVICTVMPIVKFACHLPLLDSVYFI